MTEVQTPLWELLADVPKDLRIGVETPNSLGSDVHWIPVGQLCAQASEDLREKLAALEAQRTAREEAIYETIIQWDEGGGKRSRRELARRIVALYAKTGDTP